MRQTAHILGWEFVVVGFGETREVLHPCVYLMAHEVPPDAHRVHYVGQTHNLGERFAGHHRLDAARALGATHVLAIRIETERDRRALETLLRYELRPPLNEESAPTHVQGWRAAQACGRPELAAKARAAHFQGAQPMLPPWTRTPTISR